MKKMKHEEGKHSRKSRRQRKAAKNPKICQDLFTYLPSEIVLNILSRLPAQTIMSCKCVCKPWLDLFETREFVKSHLSDSDPGLALFYEGEYSKPYKVFEFVDEHSLNQRVRGSSEVFNFNLPCDESLYSSVNGLLFLCTQNPKLRGMVTYEYVTCPRDLVICNPITGEYIKLPCPQTFSKNQFQRDTYGFGVSRTTGQYKLVKICHECIILEEDSPVSEELDRSKCQVYTVGTGLWRRIGSAGLFKYNDNAKGAFVNGNLHWLVYDVEEHSRWISCFDLETELFSTFSPCVNDVKGYLSLSALRGCLCLCHNSTDDGEIVIWLMNEYGDEKSWTKTLVIPRVDMNGFYGLFVHPIKVFENGGVLMAMDSYDKLLYFSSKAKTIEDVDVFGLKGSSCIRAITYTPSFLPLRTFTMEDICSF